MKKYRNLIIKNGALGDVLRTTSILSDLHGEITWVTNAACFPLLKGNNFIKCIVTPEEFKKNNMNVGFFDLVLSLDDEEEACRIASSVRGSKIVGAFMDHDGNKAYTDDAAGWFDMSLISRFGLSRANELKRENKRTYQDFLFEMVGCKFIGQEYIFPFSRKIKCLPITIGLEGRAGPRWPMKQWTWYADLLNKLSILDANVIILQQRQTLEEYIEDINRCDILVSGDTLCMHIAMALGKRGIAIFGPTSADEIYGYGLLKKIVSPVECIKCYIKTSCDNTPTCMELIKPEVVFQSVCEVYDLLRNTI